MASRPSRDKTPTPKGQEFMEELKFKTLGGAWKDLKAASEDMRSLISENPTNAKEIYAKWKGKYELFLTINDEYSEILDEESKAEHRDKWYDERDTYITNIKAKMEDWFACKSEEVKSTPKAASKAGSESSICSKTSSMRLAEVTRERELVERTKLLRERQALEKKLKLLEIKLQHQAESHEIERKLAESRGRSQVLEEIEENSQCLEDEDLEDGSIASKQNSKVFTKEWDARPRKTEVRRPSNMKARNLKKAYLEQYTVEEAHKIVVGFSYLDAAVGYPAAIKELQRRYGDPEIIANTYVKRVLNWPSIRADDPKALDELAVFLKECEAATRCVGGLGYWSFLRT
ncbi:hypothetical protein BSL78_25833 [Apostichopus japonicus]|uniref:Uncharacterized protein n=1 Tax=Stichopus japonicus TaxID=307972 RepID=A0A2G8JNJ0_STIJA|nr:hypothetical protein BSL78_25833 [Apostichopus japonicus]